MTVPMVTPPAPARILNARMAVEALRAGVPNRASIRQMGTEQTAVEHAFDAALASVWASTASARPGIGVAGGFGSGKSHMLGYLAEVAYAQNFVVSRVVVSKETPLSHPGHVFAAALRGASLPDRPDDAVAACITSLRSRPDALDGLEAAISVPEAGFPPVFAACVFLLRRPSTAPEVLRVIGRLWSGAKVSMAVVRKALGAAGAGRTFSLKPVPAAEMAGHLVRFVPLLVRAAGYAGWCILLDEVELIGRYTPLQRAMAYAWLASWLGLDEARRVPGLAAVYAITDDFATAVINARLDSEKLPERLLLKGREAEAALAQAGITHIERTVLHHRLLPLSAGDLQACHDKVLLMYQDAYGWPAPSLPPPERTSSRTVRQYIKGWITQWDLQRLGGQAGRLVSGTIASNYTEDASLEDPPSADDAPGLDAPGLDPS
jgi:hypothetical protein